MLTFGLTAAGFVVIFVEMEEWSEVIINVSYETSFIWARICIITLRIHFLNVTLGQTFIHFNFINDTKNNFSNK